MVEIKSLIYHWSIECVIFDLDGTLVDTLNQHIKAFEILFHELKLFIKSNDIAENMGRTPKDILLSLIPDLLHNNTKLEELAIKKENILTSLLDEIEVFPGAFQLLKHIRGIKIPVCLASSTPKFNVQRILQRSGLTDYFDIIVTGEEITIGKPNPEIFLIASNKAKIDPKRCLVIGDSPHDIQAAKAAGMRIIAVATGKHSIKVLQKENPDTITTTLSQLINEI